LVLVWVILWDQQLLLGNFMFLLTGASGGIGYDLFKELSKNNFVIGICNTKQKEEFHNGKLINIDLLDHEKIKNFVKDYKNYFDQITLIQLAVISIDGLIANYSIEDARKTFELNILSNFVMVQNLLPIMISQGWGRIIHCSSIIGNEGARGAGIYSSSKSALKGYSKSLSKEYGRFGITSNIIELGYFEKGLINNFSHEKVKKIISETSSKRLGNKHDLIEAINFIKNSNFFNGEILRLNGGR